MPNGLRQMLQSNAGDLVQVYHFLQLISNDVNVEIVPLE